MTENEVRRSGRITPEIPILIIGSDALGKVFTEETHTVLVSLHGAGIVSQHKLVAEQEVILRLVGTNREAEARVLGEIARDGKRYTYGVAFVNKKLDFWQMEFPPAPPHEQRSALLVVECSGCRGVVELRNGDFEYDVCAIHGGLARFCAECGLLTVWMQPFDAAPTRPSVALNTGKKAPPERVQVVTVEAPAAKSSARVPPETMGWTGRRGRVRAKVNFFACVRSGKFGKEIVTCIDMSRGGLGFRSRYRYEKGMEVQIAVPYAAEEKEAPAIFVRAKIVNVEELKKRELWRCGAEFLRERRRGPRGDEGNR